MSVFAHPFAYRTHCARCKKRFEPPDASRATFSWARLTMCDACYKDWEAEQEALPSKTVEYPEGRLSEWLARAGDLADEVLGNGSTS